MTAQPASDTTTGFDPRIILIGVAGGLLAGFFGVGGGIVLVPLIMIFLKPVRNVAHATSLAAIIVISIAGTIGFAIEDRVDWVAGVSLAAGGIAGSMVGAQVMHGMKPRTLRGIFAIVLIGAGLRMIF